MSLVRRFHYNTDKYTMYVPAKSLVFLFVMNKLEKCNFYSFTDANIWTWVILDGAKYVASNSYLQFFRPNRELYSASELDCRVAQ